jgi:hypothetical protein
MLVTDPDRWDRRAKPPGTRVEVMERDRETCVYCGASYPGEMVIDHVIPRTLGGSEGLENLVVACPDCNSEKADLGWEEFLARRPDLRMRFLPLIMVYKDRQAPEAQSFGYDPEPPPGQRPRRKPFCPILHCDCPVRGQLPSLMRPQRHPEPVPWEYSERATSERASERRPESRARVESGK